MEVLQFVASTIIAYFIGSVPFAHIISSSKGIDIRCVGDNNVGAFNVFRHVGLSAGLATLGLDMGKGALAIIVAKSLNSSEILALLSGIAVIIGHNWSVFLNFKGGRGESTTIGILAMLIPLEILLAVILALVVLVISKNSMLMGAFLFVPLPVLAYFLHEPYYLIVYSMVLPSMVAITHWLTTRNLSSESRRESEVFWIGPKGNITKNKTDQCK